MDEEKGLPDLPKFASSPNDELLGVTRRRQSSPTSPGVVQTSSSVPPPPVCTPPVPVLPMYLIPPPKLPKQHVYAPMAPLGALSIGLMKHKASEEDQFSRLINGKIQHNIKNLAKWFILCKLIKWFWSIYK